MPELLNADVEAKFAFASHIVRVGRSMKVASNVLKAIPFAISTPVRRLVS
jgi:hypothetical protein